VGIGGGLVVGGTITATNFVGSFSGAITAANVATVQQTANTTYYPTFVDANNVSATGEPVYTTSSFLINPGTGAVTVGTSGTFMGGLTVYKNGSNDAINTDGRIIVDFGTVVSGSIAGLTVKGDAALSTNLTIGVAQNITRTGRGSSLSGAFIDAEGSRPISFATSSTERLSIEGNGQINVRSTASTTSTTTGALTVAGGVGIDGDLWVGGTIRSANLLVDPIVVNDISTQFDNVKTVFVLKQDQTNINTIVDSKDVEVIINGARLTPYVKTLTYPWLTPYDSFRGFRVSGSNLIIYNAPAIGDSASVIVRSISASVQTRKYPYSANTIALGD
jgi:hypothetical protein